VAGRPSRSVREAGQLQPSLTGAGRPLSESGGAYEAAATFDELLFPLGSELDFEEPSDLVVEESEEVDDPAVVSLLFPGLVPAASPDLGSALFELPLRPSGRLSVL
jgi:hypothetical protein